jgi:hypothetical protein
MSIIVTAYVPEGIVMAADSRLTGTTKHENGTIDRHNISDNSQKIFLIKDNSIGISCCGDAIIGKKSVGDFIRSFEIEKIQKDDDISVVCEKLMGYTRLNHGSGVIYHICGYLNDEPYVYKLIDDLIFRSNLDKNGNILRGTAWDGETEVLTRLIVGNNNHLQFDYNFMQLKDGIDLVEFMVDVTCKTQRFTKGLATCGGTVDILVITKDYAKWVKHKVLNP